MSVGIEQLAVYVPPYVLSLDALAAARGVPAEKFVYPKFNGEGEPHDPADLAAAG